ncbi:osmotically inducible protein C [Bacteroidota bacterium]|nr:osmotically inducible protein C [Bacteroidota bacterium]
MALIEATLADNKFGMDIKDADGHVMRMDIPVEQGGSGSGFRPMQSMLAALCGCSSVDVISILEKQRQVLKGLKIEADGSREEGKEPSLWKKIQIDFKLEGEVEASKAKRAVDLSLEKYCSVAETLRRAGATITYSIYLNGSKID